MDTSPLLVNYRGRGVSIGSIGMWLRLYRLSEPDAIRTDVDRHHLADFCLSRPAKAVGQHCRTRNTLFRNQRRPGHPAWRYSGPLEASLFVEGFHKHLNQLAAFRCCPTAYQFGDQLVGGGQRHTGFIHTAQSNVIRHGGRRGTPSATTCTS